MTKGILSKVTCLWRKKDPAQLHPTQGSHCAPSQLELKLIQEKEQNKELVSENTALKEQMTAKERSWKQEKNELIKALESARDNQIQAERNTKEKEEQIHSPQRALH